MTANKLLPAKTQIDHVSCLPKTRSQAKAQQAKLINIMTSNTGLFFSLLRIKKL